MVWANLEKGARQDEPFVFLALKCGVFTDINETPGFDVKNGALTLVTEKQRVLKNI